MKTLLGLLLVGVVAARQERCPVNQHYNSCGSTCPLTCDNVDNPPKFCNLMCSPGCHCDDGYVRTEAGMCVLPQDCPNRKPEFPQGETDLCALPAKSGNCRARIIRYYFDSFSGQCRKFVFGGCGGNENNFRTLEQCAQRCLARSENEVCQVPPETGICEFYTERFYYDKISGQCKRFMWGGCGGNPNKFDSEDECKRVCADEEY